MVYQGTVQNGVIVLPNGVQLPEGSLVNIHLVDSETAETIRSPKDDILFRIQEYAVDTGISDLATNIDHYLYGHPKVADGK